MREILFRGKRTKNGEWVYGWLGHMQSYDPHTKKISRIYFTEIDDDFYSRLNTIVDYQTVGQYTGLTDKNGNKIFEGDIVEITSRYYGRKEKHLYQIKWHDSTASWNAFGLEFIQRVPLCNNEQPYYKIIGNIHENPELLKGGEG